MATLKTTHAEELNSITAAGTALCGERDAAVTARNAMRAEWDEAKAALNAMRAEREAHVREIEELDNEVTRLRRRTKSYFNAIKEIDTLLSGKPPFLRLL